MQILLGFFLGTLFASCVFAIINAITDRRRSNPSFPPLIPPRVMTLADHGRSRIERRGPVIARSPFLLPAALTLIEKIVKFDVDLAADDPWWAHEDIRTRGVVGGRHARDTLEQDLGWRKRWSEHNTQGWPTLATEGHAIDTLALDVRPIICDGARLLNVDHTRRAGLRGEDDLRGEAADTAGDPVPVGLVGAASQRTAAWTPTRRVRSAAPPISTA